MITITNADRVVFPDAGFTKGDVVAYYQRAARKMLPHLASRPLTIVRYPKGIGEAAVFQKNAPKHYPASLERIEIPRKGGVTSHVAVRDTDDIAYLANQGAIELHIPTVRSPALAFPDRLVVDLDPPAGEVALVRRAAKAVRQELESLGLDTVPVATGSKGYHLVAAIQPTTSFDQIETAMHQLATLLVARHPELLTTTFRVAKRGGRVFFDWLRNRPGATVVAPYSLRARPNAPIATPISWDELDEVAPDGVGLGDASARLEGPDSLMTLAESPADPASFVANVASAFATSGLVLETFDRFRD